MIADENTALQMFNKGALDIIGLGISPIPSDAIAKFAKKGLLNINRFPGTTIVCFNINRFPFNNLHIRKAFALALDRKEITENIAGPEGELANGIIPLGLKNGPSLSFLDKFNPLLAKQHLKIGLKELGISLEEFPLFL
ncbi:MAG: ABC transporter substrate-binding protein [Rhabdochlamydiaceae bacterium]|jgi:oligopeptide transport system substrate-binding protein